MLLGANGQTPEGLTIATSHDTSAPSVNGQTLDGITGEANLSSMEQLESTTVLSVTATSFYSINDHIQGMPVTFLVDTGSIITIVKTTVWTQADPNCHQLKPYQGHQLVGVERTPLSVRGEANTEVLLGGETFLVSVIVVDQLSSDAYLD